MAFNIQRARGSLTGRAEKVRAEGVDVRTGGREMARAVQALGGSIANLGERYYNIQAATQLSQAQRIAIERMNTLSLSFEGNLDPETYQDEYEKALEEVRKSTGTILSNQMAAGDFEMFMNDREPYWQKGVTKSQKVRVKDNWLAEMYERQASIEQSGIYGEFSKFVAQGTAEGMIDRSDAVRVVRQTKKLAAAGAELNKIESYWKVAKKLPMQGDENAIDFINNIPDITSAQRNDLVTRRKRQEEITTASTNPLVRWRVLREITDNPKKITDDYLESLIKPNSLDVAAVEDLRKIRDTDGDPLKTPRAKIYLDHLEALYKNRDIETVSDYDAKMEQLIQFFKANPQATQKQATEFYDNLINNVAQDLHIKAWRWWVQSPFGIAYRKAAGIERIAPIGKTRGEKPLSEMTEEELIAIIEGR